MAEHASQAILGFGAILYRGSGDGPPETFVPLTDVRNFVPPQIVVDEVEVTHYESTGAYREFIAGLKDAGQATGTINYNPGDVQIHNTLAEDAESRDRLNWKFVLPGGIEVIDFNAFILQFNRNVLPDDAIQADLVWRCSTVSSVRAAWT